MDAVNLFNQLKESVLAGNIDHAQFLVNSMDCQSLLAEAEKRAAEISDKYDRLKEAEQLRIEFLATISHELRTPLNSIIGYNSLLEEGVYGGLNEKQIRAIQRVDRNATRLLTLINQLLDLSRLEAGMISVFHEKADLVTLVKEILEDYHAVAEEKGIGIELTHPFKGVEVETDASKLRELIRQLISNALKFTYEGKVKIDIQADENGGQITISDTGPGIEEEKREQIFELFRQGEAYLSRRHQGAGLGLAIVRKLADLLHIQIELQSQPNQGSTFFLSIPDLSHQEKKRDEQAELKGDSSIPLTINKDSDDKQTESIAFNANQSVLIVDDDPYTVEILTEFLENRGHYRVIKAYSGMHAMINLAQSCPDYLLVDLLMPQINGERVVQYCRELWGEKVKIVVITGKDLSPRDVELLENQGATIIRKGDYTTQNLTQSLESVIPIPCLIQAHHA